MSGVVGQGLDNCVKVMVLNENAFFSNQLKKNILKEIQFRNCRVYTIHCPTMTPAIPGLKTKVLGTIPGKQKIVGNFIVKTAKPL